MVLESPATLQVTLSSYLSIDSPGNCLVCSTDKKKNTIRSTCSPKNCFNLLDELSASPVYLILHVIAVRVVLAFNIITFLEERGYYQIVCKGFRLSS